MLSFQWSHSHIYYDLVPMIFLFVFFAMFLGFCFTLLPSVSLQTEHILPLLASFSIPIGPPNSPSQSVLKLTRASSDEQYNVRIHLRLPTFTYYCYSLPHLMSELVWWTRGWCISKHTYNFLVVTIRVRLVPIMRSVNCNLMMHDFLYPYIYSHAIEKLPPANRKWHYLVEKNYINTPTI